MTNKRILTLVFVVAFLTLLVGCFPQPTNQYPIITSDPVKTATVGVAYTYDVNATDPEEDVLTYSLTTKPDGMAINSATGVISWKPTSAQVGNNPVAVVVSDGDLSVGQNFTIKVSKPSPTPIKYYTITATAGDNGTIDPLGKVKVMEGLDKTFIITPDTSYYIADVLVDGVSVGAVPSYKFNNIRKNHTINATFEVTYIPNHAPIITSIPRTTAIVGEDYTYNIIATDPDGDTLTYSLTDEPDGMLIDGDSGIISWIPKEGQIGNNAVTVKVSDGKKVTTQSFIITVNPFELTRIEVSPKTMEFSVIGEIQSFTVTAHYDNGTNKNVTNDSGCYYATSGNNAANLIPNPADLIHGWVKALDFGTDTIYVYYTEGDKDRTDTIEVTVKADIEIDGVLSPGEWDCTTAIPITGEMGTVRVLATTDYLYVAFDIVDSNDARTQYEGERGNDQISINVNPTDGGSWGFPYDLIFETSALSGGCSGSPEDGGHHCLPWDPKVNSGTSTDNWATRWFPNDAQEDLPVDLESATIYSGTDRVTEWKVPLDSIAPSVGDVFKVGGAVDVGDGSSYVYPIGLDWSNVSTYEDILVY